MPSNQKYAHQFRGNSEELKDFLRNKRKNLNVILSFTHEREARSKIKAYIDLVDDLLDAEYFTQGNIKPMAELKKQAKANYREYKRLSDKKWPEVEKAEKIANDAFNAVGRRLATTYEDDYTSHEQEEARDAIDEFQYLRYDWEQTNRQMKLAHWLLGIIHEPDDFFKGAIK